MKGTFETKKNSINTWDYITNNYFVFLIARVSTKFYTVLKNTWKFFLKPKKLTYNWYLILYVIRDFN